MTESTIDFRAHIGIIGGSGIYKLEGIENARKIAIQTPFGQPSDEIFVGTFQGIPVVFLARHGYKHQLMPAEVPYRANIYAFKMLGVKYLISISAVGSLREDISPSDIVLPDQYIDRTQHRVSTFFGEGAVAHVSLAEPVCENLRSLVASAIEDLDLPNVHVKNSGIYLMIEGPAFSTLAESELYRKSYDASIIGMTAGCEAKLAREAELAFCGISMVTDYDCWHPDHKNVTTKMVEEVLKQNYKTINRIIKSVVLSISVRLPTSKAHHALKHAIMTPLDAIPDKTKDKLHAILEPYLSLSAAN